MEVIKQKGLSIPEDMSGSGFGNDLSAQLVSPGLTTIAQPTFKIGQEAARLLLQDINAVVKNDYTIKKSACSIPQNKTDCPGIYRSIHPTGQTPERKTQALKTRTLNTKCVCIPC